MAVNLEYYRTFYCVAQTGSMNRAAEQLCLTPPTVTKTIQALEQQLDCQLFVRTSKGVHLTAAGELLLGHVKPGLNLLNAGEHEIDMLNSLQAGTVRLGMSEAAAHYFTMPAVFGAFCSRYPGIRLVIRHLPARQARAAVLAGDIDLAILGLGADDPGREFEVHRLYYSDNIPVAGRALRALAVRPIALAELAGYPLIFTQSGYSIREYYEKLYSRHGMRFQPNIETPTLDIQLKAVRLGLGYSFVPYPHIIDALRSGELFQLDITDAEIYRRRVCLITARDIPLSRAAQALIDVLLSAADSYLDEG